MKRLKPGEFVLVNGENLALDEFGRKDVRCEVVSVRRRTFTVVRTGRRKSGLEVRIRDPKGRIWTAPHDKSLRRIRSSGAGSTPRIKTGRNKRLITYSSLAMEVVGPRDAQNNRKTRGCVKHYLRTTKRIAKTHLKECAKISPELMGFRLKFS